MINLTGTLPDGHTPDLTITLSMALPLRVIYMNQNHVAIETFGRKANIQI